MMKALFDKNSDLVGWYDYQDSMIYDSNMNWVGFVRKKYVFSDLARWVGGMEQGTVVDRSGKPVAWLAGSIPKSRTPLLPPLPIFPPLAPMRPLSPLRPLKPLVPLEPIGGWSTYAWKDFFRQM